MYDLPGRFKQVRLENKLTQRQIAELIGISEQSYQRYEYGKVVPSALVLISIADALGVSLDYLVGRSDEP